MKNNEDQYDQKTYDDLPLDYNQNNNPLPYQ